MKTEAIEARLVELCRKGAFDQAHDELYADNAASIEPAGSPFPPAHGRAALRLASRWLHLRLPHA